MKLALAQINPTIGDIAGNQERVRSALRDAVAAGAELAVFPEQTLLGYPAKDLLLRRELIDGNVAALHQLAALSLPIAAIIGFAEPNPHALGRPVFNSAALLRGGRVEAVWRKRLLPTYDVFDDGRYFEPAGPQPVIQLADHRVAVTICEDLLAQELGGRSLYACDPAAECRAAGADLFVNLSASPYFIDKHAWRLGRFEDVAREHGVSIAYVNQVGGNDEVLFDGASCCFNSRGELVAQARDFDEDLLVWDTNAAEPARCETILRGLESVRAALVMGLRDYLRKCGFRSAVLGLSGGIDSAVVAALAADALGPANVHGVAMPSRFSSPQSQEDARLLAENLGIRFSVIPIESLHAAYESLLRPHFEGRRPDVTEENIQARARGAILMALSNKFGALLLTTGNKSELAAGYCTLYGDMAGGLAVISDVPKTMVYGLARHINAVAGREPIPRRSIERAPSAELRPNQTDQDSLPAYEVLDAILERYEERLQSRDEIVAGGFDPAAVDRVLRLIHISEYKRQQAAPGLKVTSRAFGYGRRMPIAARPTVPAGS